MQAQNVKQQAHQLLDNLPDSATWEDVMHRIYVRQTIGAGNQECCDPAAVVLNPDFGQISYLCTAKKRL